MSKLIQDLFDLLQRRKTVPAKMTKVKGLDLLSSKDGALASMKVFISYISLKTTILLCYPQSSHLYSSLEDILQIVKSLKSPFYDVILCKYCQCLCVPLPPPLHQCSMHQPKNQVKRCEDEGEINMNMIMSKKMKMDALSEGNFTPQKVEVVITKQAQSSVFGLFVDYKEL